MIIKNPIYVIEKDISDTTATAADVLSGKTFYLANGTKATGQIETYAGSKNVTPSEQAQTLPTQDKYVDGDIVVAPIPSNYKDTTGTDAVEGDMLAGKKAVTGAGLIEGTIPTYSGASTVTQNGTLPTAGKYVASDIVVNVPSVAESDVNFYDYDGALVAAYTAADFANLTELPSNPTHTGLVAQGWNWTLADAKTYVAMCGKLNIGQVYATSSGKTEYDIEIAQDTGFTATLGLSGTEKDWGDGTVDTLESHTYSAAGFYTIKLSGTTLPTTPSSKKTLAVRIANGVTSIPTNAFGSSYFIKYVTIPSSVTSIGESAFNETRGLPSIIIPSSTTTIGNYAFIRDYSLELVMMPKSVTSIGSSAFESCYVLKSINLPTAMTSIGRVIYSCYNLKNITIPNNFTKLLDDAMRNNYTLKDVLLQEGLTEIGSYAFGACSCLLKITIPRTITKISTYAFNGCIRLGTVTVLAQTPPTLSSTNAFPSTLTTIYIPNGTLSAYQSATNWSSLSSKLVELPA